MEIIDYQKQAEDFLKKTKTTFKAVYSAHGKYFEDDKESRDIYEITLTREGKKPFIFSFGQSIAKSGTIDKSYEHSREFIRSGRFLAKKPSDFARRREAPTSYDVLACLTKYDVGDFENFCSEFGYDSDSRKAEKIYIACQKEWSEVKRVFGDVLEQLQEIN